MITLKNILVATDFSVFSQEAMEQARALAEAFDASQSSAGNWTILPGLPTSC